MILNRDIRDNCMVLAEPTSTQGVVRDRTTLTFVLLVSMGTTIVGSVWESSDVEFWLDN